MIYEEGFYKADGTFLLYGPGPIYGPNFTLTRELKDTYTYPVEGWTWYESSQEAITALGLPIQGVNGSNVIKTAYLKAALAEIDKLDLVNSSVTDPVLKTLWENATEIKRTDPDVIQIAQQLNIDLDSLWIEAIRIRDSRV